MICIPQCNKFVGEDYFYLYQVRSKCYSLGFSCMSHLIDWQQICCQIWYIEHITKITVLQVNPTNSFGLDGRVISHSNSWDTIRMHRGEEISYGNHMSRCPWINDEGWVIRDTYYQGMKFLLVVWTGGAIFLPCAIWDNDVVFLQQLSHLINGFLHAWDLWIPSLVEKCAFLFLFPFLVFLLGRIWTPITGFGFFLISSSLAVVNSFPWTFPWRHSKHPWPNIDP